MGGVVVEKMLRSERGGGRDSGCSRQEKTRNQLQQTKTQKAPILTGPVFLRSLGGTRWRTGAARDVEMPSSSETVGSSLQSNSSLCSSVDAERKPYFDSAESSKSAAEGKRVDRTHA